MEKFRKLGLSENVIDILRSMGFENPSEIQEKAIPFALEGRNILGTSMTGSGKTLAFSSAIIERIVPEKIIKALVLVPTRELAEQVSEAIKKFSKGNLKVIAVYGGVNIQNQMRQMRGTDVLVGTPGRILDHLNRQVLRLNKVEILVLDEFDRMLDMGFAHDVGKIIDSCPKERQTMLFSATNSPDIDHLVKRYMPNSVNVSVESYVDHSKLEQVYYDVPDSLKFPLLVNLLKEESSHLVMIFCSTRRNADFVVANLNNIGINAKAIHGGLDQKKRINVLNEFHENKGLNILVCTDIAARGLDIKGVTHIYNYDLPAVSKDYIHRIGRTARAGKEGKAVNILSQRDYDNFSNITKREEVDIKEVKLPFLERIELIKPKRNFGGRSSGGGDFGRRSPVRRSSGGKSPVRRSPRRNSSREDNFGRRGSRSAPRSSGRGSSGRSQGRSFGRRRNFDSIRS
ncbi:MAG: DEAD/DEAH box helicase [Nanoarchaeota archaeon]|nr:DEAD/DEAH box helicase [Nanoarchaeota archaeon]